MARPHIEPFVDRDVGFKKMTMKGMPNGIQYKTLSMDTDNGAVTMKMISRTSMTSTSGMILISARSDVSDSKFLSWPIFPNAILTPRSNLV